MEAPEPFGGDPREQRLLVVEVAVERGAGDAEPGPDAAQGQRLHPFVLDHPDGGLDQRPFEIAVVVGPFFRHAQPVYATVLTSSTL